MWALNTLHVSSEYYAERAHLPCVDVAGIRRRRSSVVAWMRHELLPGTLGWDVPNVRAVSCKLPRGSISTVAIMASSLADVPTAYGQLTFKSVACNTLPVSQRLCYSRKARAPG